MADDRQHAKELIDQLPPAKLAAVVHLLKAILPEEDDATLSPAERSAVAEADEWRRHNAPIPNDVVLADLGLTSQDWEKMCAECLADEVPQHDG